MRPTRTELAAELDALRAAASDARDALDDVLGEDADDDDVGEGPTDDVEEDAFDGDGDD